MKKSPMAHRSPSAGTAQRHLSGARRLRGALQALAAEPKRRAAAWDLWRLTFSLILEVPKRGDGY